MKRKLTFLLAGLAVLLSAAGEARALSTGRYEFRDVQKILTPLEAGASYRSSFDIVDPGDTCLYLMGCDRGGYVPGDELSDVRVKFLVASYDDPNVEILLGSDSDPVLQGAWLGDGSSEFRFLYVFHVENIEANLAIRGDLMDDGLLQYTVTNLTDPSSSLYGTGDYNGAVWLKAAKLEAAAAIPEPGAVCLFGAGFGLVAVALRRRRT